MRERNNKYKQNQDREASIDTLNAIFGKMPPQAVDMEKSVLGALLIQSDAIYDVVGIISEKSFYAIEHQKIFLAIKQLAQVCSPIDIITTSNKLRSNGDLESIGGELYLSQLTDSVATASHLEFHAKLVQQKFIQRELIRAAAEIQRKAYDDSEDLQDVIDYAEKEIFKVTDVNVAKEANKLSDLIIKSIEKLEERSMSDKAFSGLPSGFTALDRITNGFKDSNLIILAARPSMGKTALSLNIARNIAIDFGKPVLFFSLEMSEIELSDRVLVAETEILSNRYKSGKLLDYEWSAIETATAKLMNAPLFIDDTPSLSIYELRSKARKLQRTEGLSAVVVDYLQLLNAGSDFRGNREGEISFISRSLKAMAKELNVPVIALSQLNRLVESRAGNKRPQLSDLRESGAIEQDADVVMFVHRPEYYGILQDEDGNSLAGLAEIVISKYRDGQVGIIRLKFDGSIVKFKDIDDYSTLSKTETKESKPETNNDIPTNTDFYEQAEPPF